MIRSRIIATAAAVAVGAGTLAACGTANDELGVKADGAASAKTITIAYIDWDEDVALTQVMKKVLQDKGFTVRLQHVSDAGPVFVGLDKGQVDLFLDAWLPVTHKSYWDKYGKNLTDIHTWYTNAKLTIAVPDYLQIDSIDQLNSINDKVGGKIVGIEPGAGLTKATNKAISQYGLDQTLQTSSTPAMLAALKKATDAKEPIVVSLWRPHWAYSAFPIKDLKDPKNVMGDAEKIHAIGKKSFGKDFPKVQQLLQRLDLDDTTLSQLEETVLQKHKDNPEEGVSEYLKAHPEFVKKLEG